MYSLSWSVDTHQYLCYHSQQIHRDFCKETILCGFISCEDLPPRNTPDSFCRRFTPTKSSLRCVGGIFLLWGTYLENFMSRPDVISTFLSTPLQNRGRNCVRSKRWPHYMSNTTSTYFCALTIRKQLPRNGFERSGRGQESSRGHKFSILENVVPFRDCTSATLPRFEVFLLGRACPRPCWKRVQQTGGYRLFFILLKVRTTQTAITTAATIKSISLWKYRLNNNKTKSMICKIGNNFLIYFSSSNSYLLN